MAYSPEGIDPVLDYEHEEEQVLTVLDRQLQDRTATLQVVEEGSLAELERRLKATEQDILHLSGHGIQTHEGPRLLLEDEEGALDPVSPDALLRVLKRGRRIPHLVMISSCYSAGPAGDIPSFASALVAGGVPSVVGWVRPVEDEVATKAASTLYGRLALGDSPAQAVRAARVEIVQGEPAGRYSPAWATMYLLTRDASGFTIDARASKLPISAPGQEETYRYLGESGRMKVLEKGFVGRRRELQRALRVLRTGRNQERRVAGLLILGMKGVGKSCLAARVLDRHQQDFGDLGVVVVHGLLDEASVLEGFSRLVDRWDDAPARAKLQGDDPVVARLRGLLAGPWRDRPVVIVLDDFEQNLEPQAEGDARLKTFAAEFLETLLAECRANRPKVLLTSTATFRVSGA